MRRRRRRHGSVQARPRRDRRTRWAQGWVRLRRWLAGVLALAALGALGAGIHLLFDAQRFPLRGVRVTGSLATLTPAEVRAALEPAWRGQGFFTVDVAAVRRAAESLDWVRRAQVRRLWPDRLEVRIEERVPVARWGTDALLDAQGVRFATAGHRVPDGLPRLDGPEGSERQVLARWRDWAGRLAAIGLHPVRLRLDARRAWHLVLADGMRLEVGRKEAGARLARFLAAWPRVAAAQGGRRAEYADLRYSNGFAVHWRRNANDGQEKT
ncbi:MAG: cell division protein FtsQ/DivIB [Gammaproteobacteria bacterium]|nr:MAG: cell division protein FtsQ/DivIB [Gammaproteobacteria bacterium]